MAVSRVPRPWPIVAAMLVAVMALHWSDRALLRQVKQPLVVSVGEAEDDQGRLWQFEEALDDSDGEVRPGHALADSLSAAGETRAALEAWDVLRRADSTDFRAWKQWGRGRLALGDAGAAVEGLEVAVGLRPGDAGSWNSLGVALIRLGRVEEALRAFEEAIRQEGEQSRPWLNAGIALLRLERWNEALVRLDSARSRSSGMSTAKVEAYRGQALRAMGDTEGAGQAYREAISRQPDQLLSRLGLAAMIEDPLERLRELEQLRRLESGRAVVHWTLANAYLEAGREVEAERAFDRALQLAPDEARFARDLMQFHLDREGVAEAEALLRDRFAALARDPERLFLEAKLSSREGRDSAAVAQYDAALLESRGTMAEAWLNRGAALRRLGRTADALDSYQRALDVRPVYPEAWFNIGVGRSELGDREGAIEAYDRSLELDRDQPRAWYNLGMQWSALDRYDEAIRALEQAVERDPEYESALYNLALFQRQSDHPDTRNTLDSLVIRFPGSAKGWFNRGVYRSDVGDEAEAARSYRGAIDADPTYAAAWNNLGGSLHTLGDEEGALDAFREAVDLEPGRPRYRFNLGLQLERMDLNTEALVQYHRSSQLDPSYDRPVLKIARLAAEMQDEYWRLWSEHAMLTEDSVALMVPDSLYEFGRRLHRVGLLSEARERYAEAVASGKDGVWPLYWSGKSAEEEGLLDLAVDHYTSVLETRSDFKFALYRLAIVESARNPALAAKWWSRLESAHPEFALEKSEDRPSP